MLLGRVFVCVGIFLEADLEVNQVVSTGDRAGAWHLAGRFGTDAMELGHRREKVCVDAQMQGIFGEHGCWVAGRASERGCCWGLGVVVQMVNPLMTRVKSSPCVSFLAWVVVGNLPGLPPFW